ncbi:hypothetical protein BD309DRAFT_962699 [Dichomitus squalens]|uniref:Uncharacterized protein n=2 Tax=Dichomitus squalens TaxID=114155 RepID=A0A4Q9NPE6_9APHY|nr:hypothetical protein BD309DRAFT_962699 [Dichomitus squalens]TBU58195.1 hypothetical protein BD310DRAFT_819962 [Dichomitus squalens]
MFRSLAAVGSPPAMPPTTPDDATKQALLSVVQIWLDRLQAMAVITSFFVSIDSLVYSFPARPADPNEWSSTDLLISASLGGAIILHVCASIVAYTASFVLIRYQLTDAENQEHEADPPSATPIAQWKAPSSANAQSLSTVSVTPARDPIWDAYIDLRSLVTVQQMRFFGLLGVPCRAATRKTGEKRDPEASPTDKAVATLRSMVATLSKCHTVVAVMTQLGFILALLGIVAYFWTGLPRALGIWASALLGGCLIGMGVAFL